MFYKAGFDKIDKIKRWCMDKTLEEIEILDEINYRSYLISNTINYELINFLIKFCVQVSDSARKF